MTVVEELLTLKNNVHFEGITSFFIMSGIVLIAVPIIITLMQLLVTKENVLKEMPKKEKKYILKYTLTPLFLGLFICLPIGIGGYFTFVKEDKILYHQASNQFYEDIIKNANIKEITLSNIKQITDIEYNKCLLIDDSWQKCYEVIYYTDDNQEMKLYLAKGDYIDIKEGQKVQVTNLSNEYKKALYELGELYIKDDNKGFNNGFKDYKYIDIDRENYTPSLSLDMLSGKTFEPNNNWEFAQIK